MIGDWLTCMALLIMAERWGAVENPKVKIEILLPVGLINGYLLNSFAH